MNYAQVRLDMQYIQECGIITGAAILLFGVLFVLLKWWSSPKQVGKRAAKRWTKAIQESRKHGNQ